jgi:hypothetical protein
MRILTCEPDTEIIGQAIQSFGRNIRGVSPLLKKHNLNEIDPKEWYPLKDWVNVLNDLNLNNDGMTNYFAMGIGDAKRLALPPNAGNLTLPQFLEQWGATYLMQYRGENVGSIETTKINDQHYQMTYVVTFPDDYIYGIAHGLAQRLLPSGTYFKVWYDTDTKRLDEGGTETILHIRWE